MVRIQLLYYSAISLLQKAELGVQHFLHNSLKQIVRTKTTLAVGSIWTKWSEITGLSIFLLCYVLVYIITFHSDTSSTPLTLTIDLNICLNLNIRKNNIFLISGSTYLLGKPHCLLFPYSVMKTSVNSRLYISWLFVLSVQIKIQRAERMHLTLMHLEHVLLYQYVVVTNPLCKFI